MTMGVSCQTIQFAQTGYGFAHRRRKETLAQSSERIYVSQIAIIFIRLDVIKLPGKSEIQLANFVIATICCFPALRYIITWIVLACCSTSEFHGCSSSGFLANVMEYRKINDYKERWMFWKPNVLVQCSIELVKGYKQSQTHNFNNINRIMQ